MNAFNRAAMAVIALAMTGGGVLGMLALSGATDMQGCVVGDVLSSLTLSLGTAAAWGACGGLTLLGLTLLVLELKPSRPAARLFVIDDGEGGVVTVERAGVCRLAENAATDLHGVISARAAMKTVTADDGATRIDAHVGLTVNAGSAVKQAAADAQVAIREAVESLVGIRLGDVAVSVRIGSSPPPPQRRVVE